MACICPIQGAKYTLALFLCHFLSWHINFFLVEEEVSVKAANDNKS